MENKVSFKVRGRYALFTDPLTKLGGEKCSYHIPTYEALKGVAGSIFWKPTFNWVIDKVRIINPIATETKNIKPLCYTGGNTLACYTYLVNVEYQVLAHFEWNLNRPELEKDRIDGKHYSIILRMIEKGGRRDIFLGSRECQAYVEPCNFDEGKGFYDNSGEVGYSLMFHGFDYPDISGKKELIARFWKPKVINGVIDFIKPEDCQITKRIRSMNPNPPKTSGLAEEGLFE